MKFRVLAQDEMVWAYYYKRTGRHAVSQVRVYTKNGSMTPINGAEARCHDYLELLDADYDHIIVGYSKDLEKMYKKQFNEFLELKYNPAMRGEMSNTYEASAEPTDPTL